MEIIGGIQYKQLLKKARIFPGDRISITLRSDNGRRLGEISAKVVKVYKHHVLLDFGKWKESRRIADIVLGLLDY